MPEGPFLQVGDEWHFSNGVPQKNIKRASLTSLAIAERRVDQRSSRESPPATGAIGGRGSSAIRVFPGLRSEKTMI